MPRPFVHPVHSGKQFACHKEESREQSGRCKHRGSREIYRLMGLRQATPCVGRELSRPDLCKGSGPGPLGPLSR